ncbi:hypothetical protein [Streptomyces hydrogenans]|uniref:hypothetical protein n=1 Tax=Streptomyces hydrogenans TaxID=1873719 RepID=UPI00367B1810
MTAIRTLAEFGSTAAVGPLRCGATLDDIAATLGPPWEIGPVSKRRRWPRLFSYGDVELCVCRCRRVTMICVQTWRDVLELPVGETPPAVFAGSPTHAEVTAGLSATGCRFGPVTEHQPPGQSALRVDSTGVTFTFRTASGSEPLLDSAGHWIATHDCAPPAAGGGRGDVPADRTSF